MGGALRRCFCRCRYRMSGSSGNSNNKYRRNRQREEHSMFEGGHIASSNRLCLLCQSALCNPIKFCFQPIPLLPLLPQQAAIMFNIVITRSYRTRKGVLIYPRISLGGGSSISGGGGSYRSTVLVVRLSSHTGSGGGGSYRSTVLVVRLSSHNGNSSGNDCKSGYCRCGSGHF